MYIVAREILEVLAAFWFLAVAPFPLVVADMCASWGFMVPILLRRTMYVVPYMIKTAPSAMKTQM